MSAKDLRPGRGWVTRKEIAAVFDVSVTHVDRSLRRYVPAGMVKTIDGRTYFHGRSLLDAWAEAERLKRHPDDLMSGDLSPALEEYRRHRARVAKCEADEREGVSVALAEIDPPLMQLAGVLRRAGESLTRKYGNDAGAILNEAIERWQDGVNKLLGHPAEVD